MAEKFVLQIFADTKPASAELKRFAAEQEALANRLKAQAAQPAGAGGSFRPATPSIAGQARALGQQQRNIGANEQIGLIDPATARRQQAAVLAERRRLVQDATQTLGVTPTQADEFIASQMRQGQLDVIRALRTQRQVLEGNIQAIIANGEATASAAAAAEQEAIARREAAVAKEVAARTERKAVLTERDTLLASDPAFLAAERAAAEAAAAKKAAVRDATAESRHRNALNAKIATEEQRAFVDNQLTSTAEGREVVYQRELERVRLQRLRAEKRAAIRAADSPPPTFFQRASARLRGGDPLDQKPLGQFLGGKALTTVGFAASSIALFGLVGGLTSAVKEAEELERVFNNIEFQLDSLGQSDRIDEVSQSLRQLARDAGIGAAEAARVFFQFQGAFSGDTTRALRETASAVELVRITGLSLEETVDAFTALTQNFEDGNLTIREVGDTALGLQERFGVLADQTISFAADLAPVAEAAGFTVQELEALGASAQKFSGRSGSSLAEAFGRIIPQVQANASALIGLFQSIPDLQSQVPDLSRAFAVGDIQQVFEVLIRNFDRLNAVQQNQVVALLGGRREAAALIGVLENGGQILNEWSGNIDDSGKQAERFSRLQETMSQRLARFSETLKLLGVAIFEAGLQDFFKDVISLGGEVASALTIIGQAVATVNAAFGGLPGKILLAVAALKGIQAIAASGIGQRIGGLLPSVGAGAGGGAVGLSSLFLSSPSRLALAGTASANPLSDSLRLIRAQGFTETGQAVAQNVSRGVREGYERNKGLVNAAAALVAFQLIDSFFTRLNAEAEQQGLDRFQGIRRSLEQGNLSDAQRARLASQATSFSPGNSRFINDVGQIPLVGGILSGFSAKAAELTTGVNPVEEQAAINESRRILNSQIADDLVTQINAIRDAGFLGNRDEFGRLLENNIAITSTTPGNRLLGEAAKSVDIAPDELLRIAEKAASGGVLSDEEQQIFFQAQAAFADFYANNAAFQAAAAGTADDPRYREATLTLEQATATFEGGDLSAGQYAKALRAVAEGARLQILAGVDDAERLKELYGQVNAYKDFVSQNLVEQLDLLNSLRSLRTGRDDLQGQASSLRALINSGSLNSEDLASSLTQFLELQQQIIDKRVAAADSAEEAARIAQRGIAVPKDIRVALVLQQLNDNLNFGEFADGIAADFEKNVDGIGDFNQQTAQLIVEQGLSARDARLLILDKLIAQTQALIAALPEGKIDADLKGRLAALQQERRRTSNFKADVPVEDVNRVRGEQNQANSDAEDRAREIQDARFALLEAQAGDDPIASARIGVQRARAALAAAGNDKAAILQARADLINAQNTLRDAENSLIESRFDLAAAFAADDPAEVARLAIAKAQFQLGSATNEGERISAQIAIVNAQRELRQAVEDIFDSQFELAGALVANDPVKAAQVELAKANAAVERAKNAAERNRALAQRISAQRQLQDALNDVINSQVDVAIALADVAGNTVESAQLALKLAVQKLRQLQSSGAGQADLNRARSDVINAQGAVRDALLSDRQSYFQFLFDMGRITTGQLIEYLQSLLDIPNLTRQQVRDIQLQIKQLRDELGQDFQFNLPANLALPTAYQVQRVDQSGSLAAVTDNRQVNIEVSVNSNVDLAELERVLTTAVRTPVTGIVQRRY